MDAPPILVVFGGLPGTGKTTAARALAAWLGATLLRIDAIEAAMRTAGVERVGAAGYAVANALAEANLRLGRPVVADCVNPVRDSRRGWQAVAARASAHLVNLHLVCSDPAEHRRRVEGRVPDIDGLVPPTWEDVTRHPFEARDDEHAVVDTAGLAPAEVLHLCAGHVTGGKTGFRSTA